MSAAARKEEAVDGGLSQPPPTRLVSRLDDSRDENGGPATVSETGKKEERKVQGEDEKEYFCGCGPWHPHRLQIFRDARFFTFLLCLFATIEGALVSGFTSVVLSTLERRYGFSSTATGAIASTFDVAVLVSVVFISYFGGRGHKPRWLGASLIIQATGSFIFSLPQFVFGRYRVGSSGALSTETCLDGQDFTDCKSSTNAALFFFVLGNIFIGVGAAPLFTVGTTYLDEIARPKHVSLHLGVFYMLSIVGPALGYALGGPFLSIYVDPWEETHLTPSDPGWVGAWWLCFIFCGVVSLVISVPFFCYPRLLPSSRAIREEREREMAKRCEDAPKVIEGGNKIRSVVLSFLWEIRRLVVNPSWVFMTAAISSSILVVSGFASFGPKYVETQFGLPPSLASLAVGAVAIPTGGAGVVVGGLIIYCLKLKGRRVSLLQLVISGVAVLPLLGLLLHCPTSDIAGITTSYPDGARDLGDTRFLNSSCISSCNCTSSVFEPVCGADNVVYFSPCRGGCDPTDNTTVSSMEEDLGILILSILL
ncbi:Solute carrier organic anion transporter family member 4A1 [Geodia barretti]|uniref:Solute carrier organic anion transporter family member n=1 Tax=Geodia barretti TaxID=519541 RepID=A0AA35SM41_GEOBA|nr:Solute carrier organic anion transporter family member 4A1 [Geodia barretti]